MKTIKQLLTLVLLVSLGLNAYSEQKNKVRGDTLRIRIESGLLEVATFDLKKNTLEKANIQEKVIAVLSELEKISFEEPKEGERIRISLSNFLGGKEQEFSELILISESYSKRNLVISDGQYLEKDLGNLVFEIEDRNYFVRLYLEKLEGAKSFATPEFTEKMLEADSQIPLSRKKHYGWLIENESGTFNNYFLGELPPYSQDMIEINAGIGGGWIKNQFVSGFNFRIGFAFAKKGMTRNKYFADYELLYDFTNPDFKTGFKELNGFLSLGYEKNFSMNPNKANWYGISAGLLVFRDNDFFKKNTFKIAVHKQISNSILLKPEIYFSDFFTNGLPGLRVQVTF